MTARTWRLSDDLGRPTTINEERHHAGHWQRSTVTRARRTVYATQARVKKVPPLDRAAIVVTPLHRDRRSPQDVGACAPAAKAAIDGLVDAGVLPDDNPRHLIAVLYLPPRVCGVNGLELVIIDADDSDWAANFTEAVA